MRAPMLGPVTGTVMHWLWTRHVTCSAVKSTSRALDSTTQASQELLKWDPQTLFMAMRSVNLHPISPECCPLPCHKNMNFIVCLGETTTSPCEVLIPHFYGPPILNHPEFRWPKLEPTWTPPTLPHRLGSIGHLHICRLCEVFLLWDFICHYSISSPHDRDNKEGVDYAAFEDLKWK